MLFDKLFLLIFYELTYDTNAPKLKIIIKITREYMAEFTLQGL